MENRRMKSKSEMLTEDMASDMEKEINEMNKERKTKGKKPVEMEVETKSGRYKEHR